MVRLSGAESYTVAARVFHPANPAKKVEEAKGYTALFGHFVDREEAFDEGVALFFRAPHSYTGEDVVELSCHGGNAVARRLVEACLAAGAQPAEAKRQLVELALDSIVPNPAQPRKTFDDESISELAQSIRQVGLIQPLVVRKNGETYELIAGERRLRALRSLGSEKALCIVDNSAVDADSALMAVVENLQREDLNYFEEAECYKALLDELKLTQEELASRLGKSQSFIANKLRILKLSPEVREAVGLYGLSERHARAVLRLSDDADKLAIIKKAGEDGLSVKDTERLVEKKLNSLFDSKKDGAKPRPVIMRIVKDYRMFMNTVNSACEYLRSGGMNVDVSQSDRADGVDIMIHVTQNPNNE